jgi:hypothetical protein
MQTGSSGTPIGWKSGQTTFVPLWDRMEGAWLRTLSSETTFHYCWRVKSIFKLVWMNSTSPIHLIDWLLVEVALLLIGLTKISLTKSSFYHPSVIESSLRLRCGPVGFKCKTGNSCMQKTMKFRETFPSLQILFYL